MVGVERHQRGEVHKSPDCTVLGWTSLPLTPAKNQPVDQILESILGFWQFPEEGRDGYVSYSNILDFSMILLLNKSIPTYFSFHLYLGLYQLH
jgi:hypothetical protein